MGMSEYHPSHARLQTASMMRGITVNRVHTLHGLEWRAHVASSI